MREDAIVSDILARLTQVETKTNAVQASFPTITTMLTNIWNKVRTL